MTGPEDFDDYEEAPDEIEPYPDGDEEGDDEDEIAERDPWEDEDDGLIDGVGFAEPGGESALRAATPDNPRNLPCPTCKAENVLTPIDAARGYQCNACARQAERGF